MNVEESKKKAERKLAEINSRIEELKSRVPENEEARKKIYRLVGDLEKMRDDFGKKYEEIRKSGEDKWDEFNKNIYRDLESFERSFREAGSLFRPERGIHKPKRDHIP